ncbi:hypothetical protein ACFQU3_02325 [Terrabacter sp. GCM10028922]|uniref:hypothetical protein n=1 Tax=Terrabacter sp. GCM10028922 TaxID=3273428 RepID=UPI003618F9F9
MCNDARERHEADARLRLGRPVEGFAAVDVDELSVDEDGSAIQVVAVDGEAEDLALPQAGAGGQDDECLMSAGHFLDDGAKLAFGDRVHPGLGDLGQLRARARVRDDTPVGDLRDQLPRRARH